jgi:hypothetical protein
MEWPSQMGSGILCQGRPLHTPSFARSIANGVGASPPAAMHVPKFGHGENWSTSENIL